MQPLEPEAVDAGVPPGSISRLIDGLKQRDQLAIQTLWERYFQPLVRIAASRLDARLCRAAGADDIAQEAFLDFCENLAHPAVAERFPRLHNREHLWKLLVCFTARAAFDFNKKASRQAEKVAGESALGDAGFAPYAGREPCPEFSAAVAELLEQLPDPTLRRIAVLKMEGCTNKAIAQAIGKAVTTVEVKLKRIRGIWKDLLAPPSAG